MTFAHKFTVHAEDIEGVLVARVVLDGVGAWTNYSTHGDAEPIEENSEGEWPVLACEYGPAVAKCAAETLGHDEGRCVVELHDDGRVEAVEWSMRSYPPGDAPRNWDAYRFGYTGE